ncbi:MAG: AMP-binding protein, partial [Candidatus Rokubacteria bacterium]|nr:AMP-binding protein [Candidatus Rokubacteria bacterium]
MTAPRPWTRLYPARVPAELPAPVVSAVEQFEAAARRHPSRPALHYFDWTLSYGDVDRMADGLAASLARLGLNPGDRVALYLQNVPQFAIAQYAVWKAGGIVVPLNPMFKEAELAYHLNDSGARVLISLESLYAQTARVVVPKTPVEKVITTSELDFLLPDPPRPGLLAGSRKMRFRETLDFNELLEKEAGLRSCPRFKPRDVAYLSYTSGTTGPPKGAMNTHANVVYNAQVST